MKLGDIARESRETYKGNKTDIPIVGLEHLISGELRFNDYEVNTDNTFTKVFHKGQILFGRRRAYLKKAAVAEFDGICSGDITVIEAIPGKVDARLLPFIVQNDRLFDFAVSRSAGGLSPRVKWEHLADYEFELPSIEEQRVLADKLWAAYELKEAYKKMIAATDEMVKSQFIEMFEGDKYPSVKLSYIASEWLKGQSFRKDDIVDNGNSMCIHYGELFTKYGPIINQVLSRTNVEGKRTSKVGDILFPASDVTPNGLARCSMLPYDNIILGGDIIVLRPKRDCNAAYLSYAINQQTAQLLIRVNGAVVKHMSAKALMTVVIPMPPLEEQNRFVSLAQQADKSKFVGFKSQFIEMFKNESLQVPLEKIVEVKDDCRKPINEGERSEMKEGDLYPYYGATGIVDYINDYITDEELLCIAEDCGNYKAGEESAYIIRGKAWVNNHAHLVKVKDSCDIKYLYYYLKITNLMPYVSGTTRLKLTQKKLKEILVTLPSAELQNRFVAIAQQADKSKLV